jgi:GNAT superfamily N-acetyltransferase
MTPVWIVGMNSVATGKQPGVSAHGREYVRDADPEDVEQIATIHVRSWQAAYRGLLPQEYLDRLDPADRLPRWRHRVADTDRTAAGVLVAVTDGQICGAAWFGPARDTDADSAQVGELIGIYLLADAWGKGVGRSLMITVLERLAAAGYSQATLWVLESNVRARRFYAQAGWSEDGAVKQDDRLGFPMIEVRYRRRLSREDTRPATGTA